MWKLDKVPWQEHWSAVMPPDPTITPTEPTGQDTPPNRTGRATNTSFYQKGIGLLIWLAFAALGVAVLYWFSILAGDQHAAKQPQPV